MHTALSCADILELSPGCVHIPEEEHKLLQAFEKGIRWLFAMSQFNLPSRRVWELCHDGLQLIALGMDCDLSDMPPFDDDFESHEPLIPKKLRQTITHASGAHRNCCSADCCVCAIPGASEYTESTVDLVAMMHAYLTEVNAYFLYDPISGELNLSFFPPATDEELWDQG
ncbi:hypothetical protein EYZ11_011722 [Aspergillus tanneri]|uniref:Transcription factor domain-containing protein n=1 Tax=Aspergillus tanneri TaxID=1220188 RepID=A0A4S3J478_9EURO|nr:uncharacterized protein ATNIH1004_007558 [Aspergillus tanneri]KAA8646132.1 hypothetical protein ATNIH1004_007558 [Aspergillus tanneri]THC88828.1 hypothetical protein EYZ11_011722 [Aspergillus tanneri]